MLERGRARFASAIHPASDGLVDDTKVEPEATRLTARGGLGTVADVLAVVSALGGTASLVWDQPVPQAVLALMLGFLALSFMGLSFRLQRQLSRDVETERRRARHSQSLQYLQQSAGQLRTASSLLESGEHPSSFAHPAQQACTSMAAAMTIASGRTCRVVVKTVYAPGGREDVAVRTFTSSVSEPQRRDTSKSPSEDWVKENTDFDEIFYQNKEFFVSNDLEHERGYKNSHFTPQSLANGYPYLSTIVWPIYAPDSGDSVAGWDILGFLCVDTKGANSFDPDVDVLVGQVLAPVWYMALQRYEAATELTADERG